MKTNYYVFLSLLFCAVISSCNDSTPTPPTIITIDYTNEHKYFPLDDGNKWIYELTIVDELGQKTILDQKAIYSQDSQVVNFYRDGVLWSWLTWKNVGSKLACCGDRVLLDYSKLSCDTDSVLIYESDSSSPQMNIYQFCNKSTISQSANYKSQECVKTVQHNTYTSGNTLVISSYFGLGVGLIYQTQTTYDELGYKIRQEILELKSHSF